MLKSQFGFSPILILLLIIVIAGVGIGGFYLGKTKTDSFEPAATIMPSAVVKASLVPDGLPEDDVLYMGVYKNQKTLFVTNANYKKTYENGVEKIDPFVGQVYSENGVGYSDVSFKEINEVKKLGSALPFKFSNFNSFKLSHNNLFLFLSVSLREQPDKQYIDDEADFVFKIDLNNFSRETLLKQRYMAESRYKEAGGALYIKDISPDNNYLVMDVGGCYACDGGMAGKVILNVGTKQDKYYGYIDNIKINSQDKTFSYQKSVLTSVKCDPETELWLCQSDGTKKEYLPTGPVLIEKLP